MDIHMHSPVQQISTPNLRDLIAATGLAILPQSDPNRRYFDRVTLNFGRWHWKTIENLFPSMPPEAMCDISKSCMNSNSSYHTEALKSEPNCPGFFTLLVTLKYERWPSKTMGHIFYATLTFVHHFKAIGEVKLELQSENAQVGSKLTIFCPVSPWNLTDDLEKQHGISSMLLQALCIILLSSVN